MIKSFKCRETERLFEREYIRRWGTDIQRMARRKLEWIEAAKTLEDLRVPPGNRLEKLKGNREGQHSIRVNDQWRICFEWHESHAWNVEIVDYH
ncbi:MAG: type II toxin-antitoxin system RelE/ParE family toxin [Kiritimatiellia bacterium]|jgi:proteic killer suppression protein